MFAPSRAFVATDWPPGAPDRGKQNPLRRDVRKSYYLTKTSFSGSQAVSACAMGYHLASLWEILDTSNLRYNTELGITTSDSGFGPPTNSTSSYVGWIRTGNQASGDPPAGSANCHAWTSANASDFGTIVQLAPSWQVSPAGVISPWIADVRDCDTSQAVWCVED